MSNLPQGFVDYIAKFAQLDGLADALSTEPETSVRINAAKPLTCSVAQLIANCQSVPWCCNGYYLEQRPRFTFDPALHRGAYYVQDASSMAIAAVLTQIATSAVRYLDACAAPGGKTTCAIDALPEGSMIVANEYDNRRADILAENIAKWGNANVVVSRGDTAKFRRLTDFFDIVAVDAPCSGEGMMRKDAQAVDQWSPSLVNDCAILQREILDNCWQALRPGGFLIYSTCTFNLTENENNLEWLIKDKGAESVCIEALESRQDVVKGIDTPYFCYRFIPGKVRGEGLFLAVVRKPGSSLPVHLQKLKPCNSKEAAQVSKWLAPGYSLLLDGDTLSALPAVNADAMSHVANKLNTVMCGTPVAVVKGRDYIPSHQLALSSALNINAFNRVEVDNADAIHFLQREAITLPDNTPKGFVLLTYEGQPLGFVKNIGNRSNNLLPKQWRILSRFT